MKKTLSYLTCKPQKVVIEKVEATFPHACLITGLEARVTRQLSLVKGRTVLPSGAPEFTPVISASALTWFISYIYY
jgi:hypothetical protein